MMNNNVWERCKNTEESMRNAKCLVLFFGLVAGLSPAAKADGPVVTLSPTSIDFGQVFVGIGGVESGSITVTNTGNQDLHISGVVASGDGTFMQTSCNPGAYPPGASCIIGVSWAPTQAGVFTGTVSITDDATDSPQVVPLRGKGTFFQFTPPNLDFGSVFPGQKRTQTVSVTNTSSAAIGINGMATGGPAKTEFVIEGNTCGTSLAGGATCTITVSFAPSQYGKDGGTVFVGSTQAGSPNYVGVFGNATQLDFRPWAINFGTGSSRITKILTVTNLGDVAVSFFGFQFVGPKRGYYQVMDNQCAGGPLAPQASCLITIQLTITFPGSYPAALQITDDAAASPQTVVMFSK